MMEVSFKSFNEIINEYICLISKPKGEFWAHISGFHSQTESLVEHSRLVADYFEKLVESHNLEKNIENQIISLIKELNLTKPENVGAVVKEIFVLSILFHDLGKVNPNFQRNRMKNTDYEIKTLSFDSQHSSLGAFLFSSFFVEKLVKVGLDKDTNTLLFLVFCFSNPIYRHHSPFLDFRKDFEGLPITEFIQFLEKYDLKVESKILINLFKNLSFDKIEKEFKKNANPKIYFRLYSLLKLNFSLLTASDYYATGEYMSGMEVNDFGLLNSSLKEKINNDFRNLKAYNKDLFNRLEHYQNLSFDDVQIRNGDNLNTLRQKLNAEVIAEIRKFPHNHWYYIEAPTGAGKTNLSLACVNELLFGDESLNKVFYVFPFTTLITQTFISVKETIGLTSNELLQLHSKSGFHQKEEKKDGVYGNEKLNFLDNLFANYPFTITSHVKFFDILKGNSKESNYLFHRLVNSIVILDEIQSYDPKHWDKLVFFFEHVAPLFNMRIIIMSATLPKIDALSKTLKGQIISLTPSKELFFKNANFAERVNFNFSLLNQKAPQKEEKPEYLNKLAETLFNKSEFYAKNNSDKVRTLIEFITKNSASLFNKIIKENNYFSSYTIYLLSGDILEPRRKEVISKIKKGEENKILVISTQVIEAGVDVDMDIGFKNHAILDSDEQLAGRINRNATKENCEVYLFKCDGAKTIYGNDERYKQQQSKDDIFGNIQQILKEKSFHKLYEKVFEEKLKIDLIDKDKLEAYTSNFSSFDFQSINNQFQLIEDNQSQQIFIPIKISIDQFEDKEYLNQIGVVQNDMACGTRIFDYYKSILKRETDDFLLKMIDIKKLAGVLSSFTINVYPTIIRKLADKFDEGENGQFGFKYLLHHNDCYTFENGFDFSNEAEDFFL